LEVIVMCQWEDIVQAIIDDNPTAASELLAQDECLLDVVEKTVKGKQINPEDIAQEVHCELLRRWYTIRSSFVKILAKDEPPANHIPLLRTLINWLIKDAIPKRKQRPKRTVRSLDRLIDKGGWEAPAPEDPTIHVKEKQNKFWKCVSKLPNIRSRVLLKFRGIIEGTTHEEAKLTEEEQRWRPDPTIPIPALRKKWPSLLSSSFPRIPTWPLLTLG
jgi:hypothetical protein